MDLIEKVEDLIIQIQKTHKYSVSRIYGLYNEVFSTAETAQSCASCLIRKVNELKIWLADQKSSQMAPNKSTETTKRATSAKKSKVKTKKL